MGCKFIASIVISVTLAGCCAQDQVFESASGHGGIARVSLRNCGATTRMVTIVSVGGRFLKTDVLAIDRDVGETIQLIWSGDGNQLLVRIPKEVADDDIYIKKFRVRNISIEYRHSR